MTKYRVSPLEADRASISVEIEARNDEEARKQARPLLRARGTPDHDPLVVEHPLISSTTYEEGRPWK